MQDPVKSFSKESLFHPLGASPEVELDLDPVPLLEPRRCLARLELEIVVSGPYFDLDRLGFGGFGTCFCFLGLFLELVLVFAVLHHFADRWFGIGVDLDEVDTTLLGERECISK